MPLLDGLTPIRDIEPCKVGKLLLELEPADSRTLANALTDDRWSATHLAKALTERGVKITPDTLRAHIAKVCRCSRI